jgi:hypothetical protein
MKDVEQMTCEELAAMIERPLAWDVERETTEMLERILGELISMRSAPQVQLDILAELKSRRLAASAN